MECPLGYPVYMNIFYMHVLKGKKSPESSNTKSHSMVNANYTYSHKSIINIHKITITVAGKVTFIDVIRNGL
jgi:hypothetical protein